MRAFSTNALMGVSLIALTTPMSAMAQAVPAPAPGPAAEAESEIIVTARRRDERIQDVPAVINAVTSEAIAKLNFRDLREIQSVAPGLELTNNSNGTGGNARLRGVNFDVAASGNNPTVEFYLNDAPITAGVLLQQMFDVGQIEVLRGPQGTLRGRASPAGSITVTTKKPDLYRFGGYVSTTANDIGTLNLQGGLNVPVIEGIAAIRVAGVWDQNENDRVRTIKRTGDGRDPYARTWSGRVTAVIEPADWLHLEGMYQRFERSARTFDQVESFSFVNPAAPVSVVPIRASDRLSIAEGPRSISQTYNIYNGRAELSLVGQKLIYQFQHYTQHINGNETQDPADIFPGTFDQITDTNIRSTSHEVRLQNEERVAGLFDYVIGFFDNKNNTPSDITRPTLGRFPLAAGGGGFVLATTPITRTGNSHETSFFGNLTAHIGQFHLSGGVRQIDYEDFSGLLVPGIVRNDTQDLKKTIYTASAQYFVTPDIMVYASTGTSFRPGVTLVGDFSTVQSARQRSFQNLAPESSTSYEGGIKSSLFDRRVRLNVSGYHQTYKNFPFRIPSSGVFYVSTTAAGSAVAQFNFAGAVPVEVNGVEAEAQFQVTPRFSVGVVASYSLGKIKSGTIPCTDLNGDGVPDTITTAPTLAQLQAATGGNNISACTVTQRSSFLPPLGVTLQSEYNLPINAHVDAYLRGLLSYNGRSQGNPTSPFDDASSYGLLNLYAGVRDPDGKWEINLFAKNILDETKILSRGDPLVTSYRQLPTFRSTTTTSTYTGITTTAPREFGVNLRFAFGSR